MWNNNLMKCKHCPLSEGRECFANDEGYCTALQGNCLDIEGKCKFFQSNKAYYDKCMALAKQRGVSLNRFAEITGIEEVLSKVIDNLNRQL